jgi:anti-sigma-K factor RskA
MTQKNATTCWLRNMPSAPCAEGRGFSSRKGFREPALAARVAYWQEMFSTLDSHLVPVPPPETVWKRIALDLPPKKPLRQSRPYLGWMVAASSPPLRSLTWYSTRTPELAPLMVLNDAQQHGEWVVSADSRRQHLSIAPLRPTPSRRNTACSFG